MGASLRGAAGLIVSLVAHGVAGVALYWAVSPQPVAQQQMPQIDLTVETAQVLQKQAIARDADGARAQGLLPEVGLAQGDAIPQREARTARLYASAVAASNAGSGDPVPEVSALSTPVAPAAVASGAKVVNAAPTVTTSDQLATSGARVPDAEPNMVLATAASAPSLDLRAGVLPDARVSSAMAWSGADQLALDPAGLLALTAFVAPQQAGARGEDLRDGVSDVLSSVPCARLQTAFNVETGALELRGHLPDAGLRDALTSALRAQIGDTLPVSENLRLLPEPQCGTLGKIDALGLPQSEEQFIDPFLVGANLFAREYEFRDGDRMVIDLEGSDYPAYIYLDYYDAEGNVLHLIPNNVIALRQFAPEEAFSVGAAGSGLELIVEPPLGQDIAVAIASDRPLYEGLRPVQEPAAAYLEFLRRQVATVAPDRAEWVYFFVETVAAD